MGLRSGWWWRFWVKCSHSPCRSSRSRPATPTPPASIQTASRQWRASHLCPTVREPLVLQPRRPRLNRPGLARSLGSVAVGGGAVDPAWGRPSRGWVHPCSSSLCGWGCPWRGCCSWLRSRLAFVSRLQPQLQLLSLSFPGEMLGTVVTLAMLAPLWRPSTSGAFATSSLVLERMLGR